MPSARIVHTPLDHSGGVGTHVPGRMRWPQREADAPLRHPVLSWWRLMGRWAFPLVVTLALGMSEARGGLTASDVVVVVNGNSFHSRTLANHFISLRRLPATNVIVLDQVPDAEVISVDEFRSKILAPLLAEIDRRRLSQHIQCITYSADFPTAIDISADLKDLQGLDKIFTKRGSLNGLTFLYTMVGATNPSYIGLNTNFYARGGLESYFQSPAGRATLDVWQEIQRLVADQKHRQASTALQKLFEEHPHQFPLAYLAAAEAALAGQPQDAVKLMEQAVSAGWTAGGYLAQDDRFDAVRDDPDFQVLEFLLDDSITDRQPVEAFDARLFWSPNGIPVKSEKLGRRYMLSTVLGVTRGSGTTLSEAVEALRRSAAADFTHPRGGFYFCQTRDVRSKTRQPGFADAVEALTTMGFEAEVVPHTLPLNKPHVLGAQTGTSNFNWETSGSTFVPGALADNLTSLGGVMTAGSGQTKLTEFIKAGAAGSSGAVVEPYALQQKFPLPQMYVHYAQGVSLVEAFYLNTTCPYQLLIVGDPLCRPFSNAPTQSLNTSLRHLDRNQPLQLELDLSGSNPADWPDDGILQANRTQPLAPVAISFLFDGIQPQTQTAHTKLNISLPKQPDGYHEVTLRLIANDALSQRAEVVLPIWIGPQDLVHMSFPDLGDADAGHSPSSSPPANGRDARSRDPRSAVRRVAVSAEKLIVRVDAEQAARITLWHDEEQLGVAAGSDGEFSIPLSNLGLGPVRLQAKAELEDGSLVQGLPHWIDVVP